MTLGAQGHRTPSSGRPSDPFAPFVRYVPVLSFVLACSGAACHERSSDRGGNGPGGPAPSPTSAAGAAGNGSDSDRRASGTAATPHPGSATAPGGGAHDPEVVHRPGEEVPSGVALPGKVTDLWTSEALVDPSGAPCSSRPKARFSLARGFSLSDAYLVSHFALYDIDVRWSEAAIERQLRAIGFADVEFIPAPVATGGALKGFLASSADLVYLHVKGTTGNWGWAQNALFTTWPAGDLFPDSGWQHVGFRDYYRALKESWGLEGKLRARAEGDGAKKPILFSGHSQGAAVVLLAAARAKQAGLDVLGLYNSGQPRAGDANFNARLASILDGKWHRFRYGDDVVPHMPPVPASGRSFDASAAKMTKVGFPFGAFVAPARYGHAPGFHLRQGGDMVPETPEADAAADVAFWNALAKPEGEPGALTAKRVTDDHYPEAYHCALARALEREQGK